MSADIADTHLSRYRLIRLLGSGGMGAVYLAHDPLLDRHVAIKVVAPEQLDDPSARRRLVREARAAANLDHPCICAVHEVLADEARAGTCIVMAYVEGDTLAERLLRGRLEVREALSLAADLAGALAAAHERGIVHRDLKPQNIMLTASGRPKLLDFGIASLVAPPTGGSPVSETQTDPAGPLPGGTPGYMAPERLLGKPGDARADLFSLGVVLYEALTGVRPFGGRTNTEIHGRVLHHEPPAVSSLRPELTPQHDELCRRLLAKDPADRFQSAEELLGALRVLLPGTTGGTGPSGYTRVPLLRSRSKRTLVLTGLAAVLVAVTAWSVWRIRDRVPEPPESARQWFEAGSDALRQGAYFTALLRFEEAVKLFPEYHAAFIRMAEAHHELDQPDQARTALLRVEPSRLLQDDRLRHDAIKALLIPRSDEALRGYQAIANRHPADAGAWLDLGRAQEYAGLLGDARQSYERALVADPQNAAAHLRAGAVYADAGDTTRALAAYAEAERLYAARSNVEGEAETLLRRGSLLEMVGQLAEARAALEKALGLARDNRYQAIRAQLLLSSVTISQGRLDDAARLASAAIALAEEADLDQVAAMGLIELGYSLSQVRQTERADEYLARAVQLATRRGARRTEMRARLQQAALRLDQDRHREALEIAQKALPFLRDGQYRRYELTALSIISRAHEQLGDFGTAKTIADNVLRVAEAAKDQVQIATALENLAELATIAGDLPLALQQRLRCLEINRSLQDLNVLPYDLTNTAYLLIRLGRGLEAAPLIAEVEDGITRKIAAYEGRTRRVAMLKALDAAIAHDFAAVDRFAGAVMAGPRRPAPDSTERLAGALQDYAAAHAAARTVIESSGSAAVPPDFAPDTKRELMCLQLLTGLARRDWQRTLDGAAAALDSRDWPATTEFEWRIAAIGAAAARGMGAADRAQTLTGRARDALARLRREWTTHADAYERRPDLVALRRQAGIE